MPRVVISNSQGLVQKTGSGLDITSPVTLASSPVTTVSAQTAATTLTVPGVYTLSGSTATLWVMPLASAVPGGTFVFRCASAHAHLLTGSQETSGTKVFAGQVGATPENEGSLFALPAVVGSSAVLISDGRKFLMMAASGSCVISAT